MDQIRAMRGRARSLPRSAKRLDVTQRFAPLAGAVLALALAACGPSAATPVASTSPSAGSHPAVPATGAGLWFAPAPANAHDLLALVEPNAPWGHAASATSVFQLSASSIAALSDADLATLAIGLKRLGLPIAVLVPALTPSPAAGQVAGSPDATAAPDLLRRVKAAGGAVRFIAMEESGVRGNSVPPEPDGGRHQRRRLEHERSRRFSNRCDRRCRTRA